MFVKEEAGVAGCCLWSVALNYEAVIADCCLRKVAVWGGIIGLQKARIALPLVDL